MSIKNSFEIQVFWWIGIIFILSLLILSMTAMLLENKNKSIDDWHNIVADKIKRFVVLFPFAKGSKKAKLT